jgi:hypothetical protein
MTSCTRTARAAKGKPFECIELARTGAVNGATCRELLDELGEKLQTMLSFSAEQSVDTLAELLTFLHVVPITGELKAVPADPDDDKERLNAPCIAARHSSSFARLCYRQCRTAIVAFLAPLIPSIWQYPLQ